MNSTKICFFLFLGFLAPLYAQKKVLKQARINFELRQFYKSITFYEKSSKTHTLSDEDQYKVCICEYQLSQFDDARKCMSSMLKSKAKVPVSIHYFLSKSYKHENELDSAIMFMDTYISNLKNKNTASDVLMQAIRENELLLNAKKTIANHQDGVVISHLGNPINSIYPEYGPIISDDEKTLFFTSCRPETTGGAIEITDGIYHEDIYISNYDTLNKQWSVAKQVENVNSERNDAVLCVNKNTNKMLIYRHGKDLINEINSGDLYMAEKNNGTWQNPKELKELNTDFDESSATISPDEKYIIFSSNRPEGKGGQDLYITRKMNNGKWSNPENLSQLNTVNDEDSPFLHADGKTLYFSTNGHKSLGGYDIYYSKFSIDNNTWAKPIQVPYPISTLNDDLYFSMNKKGTKMFMSYILENSLGYKDIYSVNFPDDQSKMVIVNGSVKNNKNEINDIKITVKLLGTNKVDYYYTDSLGNFQLQLHNHKNYMLYVENENFKQFYKMIDLSNNDDFLKIEDEVITLEEK